MAAEPAADRLPSWAGPEQCPFCGAALADGGPAFIDHVDASPDCAAGFDAWRVRVVDDIAGGWAG